MEKHKAIPQGYMTIGELAKKMNVTVRTLQYYDREGLLSPSSESEGGRRLYTDKDVVYLHQILSMKHLGFSLDDIKKCLVCLNTPAEVGDALAQQATAIREKIIMLTESLQHIQALQAEVVQMQTVNFKKYADIVVNLQMRNEFYWLIKHFDDSTLDHFRSRFTMDSGMAILDTFTRLRKEAIRLQESGVSPQGERGQAFAKEFWAMVIEFTDGDMSLLPKLMEAGLASGPDEQWQQQQQAANAFIEPALDAYFSTLGTNPFEEAST